MMSFSLNIFYCQTIQTNGLDHILTKLITVLPINDDLTLSFMVRSNSLLGFLYENTLWNLQKILVHKLIHFMH